MSSYVLFWYLLVVQFCWNAVPEESRTRVVQSVDLSDALTTNLQGN